MLDYTRQMEIFNPREFNTPVHIIGAGSTGSWLALTLAKLGIEDITVWDFDTVEEHNIPNQAYRVKYNNTGSNKLGYIEGTDINDEKVSALRSVVKDFTDTSIKIKNEKVDGTQRLSGVVFMMTDTMSSRKEIFERAIELKQHVKLLIEPRMGLDMGRIYNIEPVNLTHIKKYKETFYSDEEATTSACGASQSVITTAMSVASTCARQLINWHNNVELPNEILMDFKYNNYFTEEW